MHHGSAGHVEPLGACVCAPVRLCPFPQGPGDSELACRQRPLPLIPGIKATQLSRPQLVGLFCVWRG